MTPLPVPAAAGLASTTGLASNAGYDLVLLAHVLSVLIGLGAVAAAGGSALALRRPGPPSEALRRYYRPGVNWAGRVLFLVPVFGAVLIAMSHRHWSYSDRWVGIGLAVWAGVALAGEMVLWPAERRLQVAVGGQDPVPGFRRQCLMVVAVAAVMVVALIAATVVMVAKP
jgi:hypothetical protein